MSGRRLLGFVIAVFALLILLALTPVGSWLRGQGSDFPQDASSSARQGSPSAGRSTVLPGKTGPRAHSSKQRIEKTEELLSNTIIEEAHLVDLTLPECVDAINRLIEEASVDRSRLQLVLSERTRQVMKERPASPWHEVKLRNEPVYAAIWQLIRWNGNGVWIQVGEGTVELDFLDPVPIRFVEATSLDLHELAGMQPKPDEAQDPPTGNELVRAKLNEIITPVIDFEDTTIEEALDFLRSRSRELDLRTLEPEQKGILFVIRDPHAEDDLNGLDLFSEPILTMRGVNIPLAEALDRIAQQAGLLWRIDDDAVVISPADPGTPMEPGPKER